MKKPTTHTKKNPAKNLPSVPPERMPTPAELAAFGNAIGWSQIMNKWPSSMGRVPSYFKSKELHAVLSLWNKWNLHLREIQETLDEQNEMDKLPLLNYDDALNKVCLLSKTKKHPRYPRIFLDAFFNWFHEYFTRLGYTEYDAFEEPRQLWDCLVKGTKGISEFHVKNIATIYSELISQTASDNVRSRWRKTHEKTRAANS